MKFTRITVEPEKMGGAPCIRGLRIPVATVVGMIADAMTVDEILADYPDLQREDIEEALRYAAEDRAALERSLADVRANRFASEQEVEEVFARFRPISPGPAKI